MHLSQKFPPLLKLSINCGEVTRVTALYTKLLPPPPPPLLTALTDGQYQVCLEQVYLQAGVPFLSPSQ